MQIVTRYLTYLACVLFILSSAGCARLFGKDSHFQQKKNEYLQAEDQPPLRLPADLSRVNISDYYDIPEVSGEPGKVSVAPPEG